MADTITNYHIWVRWESCEWVRVECKSLLLAEALVYIEECNLVQKLTFALLPVGCVPVEVKPA